MTDIHRFFAAHQISFKIFFLALLLLGLNVAFVQPPFSLPDEGAHYLRAYEVSHFKLLNTKGYAGVNIPCAEYNVAAIKYNPIAFQQDISQNHDGVGDCTVKSINSAGTYSFVSYLPAAFAIRIAEILRAPVEVRLVAARSVSFILYFSIICYGIGKLVKGKPLALCIILMPSFFWQMAALSADGATIAFSWGYILLILFHIQKNISVKRKSLVLLSLLGLMIGLSKGVYAPVCLFSFALWRQYPSKHTYLRFAALFFPTVAALLSFVILAGVADPELIYLGNGAKPLAQLAYVAGQPFEYLKACVVTLSKIEPLKIIAPRYAVADSLVFGPFIVKSFMLVWVLSLLTTDFGCGMWVRLLCLMVFLTQIVAICLPLYLTYTPVGFRQVLGLQGRYLFPIIPFLIVALGIDIRNSGWVRLYWQNVVVIGLPISILFFACVFR